MRYVGEPVAVVVAANRYLAEDALDLIEIDYEPLAAVVDPLDALALRAELFMKDDVQRFQLLEPLLSSLIVAALLIGILGILLRHR